MNASDPQIAALLERFLNNSLTTAELEHFRQLANEPRNQEALAREIESILKQSDQEEYAGLNEEEIFRNILSESETIRSLQKTGSPMDGRVHSLYRAWFRYAAIILLAVGTVVFLFTRYQPQSKSKSLAKANTTADILPGGNKAMLTLSDGSVITLDSAINGPLTREGNTNIIKPDAGSLAYNAGTATGELLYNTITTPRGGQYQVTLSDGSKVWLNAASSVRFPAAFAKERTVMVTGEVYFEIAQDKTRPFLVIADDVQVQVLGTSFNVNAYADEKIIKTTLLEGRVRISAGKDLQNLIPGQQAQRTRAGNLSMVNNADIQKVMAWKNGFFNFKDADLPAVMRQLERWYDIRVKYAGAVPVFKFQGELERGLRLSQVLKILSDAEVKFRLEDRLLIIMP